MTKYFGKHFSLIGASNMLSYVGKMKHYSSQPAGFRNKILDYKLEDLETLID